MKSQPLINVCVCTYLRPKYLVSCIDSLINQETPKGANYSITIIDNDENQTAKEAISKFKAQSKVVIHYFCEEKRGIPFARNRALDESLRLGVDYIAFIDDDEQASSDWLSTLYTYACSYPNPVVIHGHVMPKFPDNIPQHIRSVFYTRKERLTGTRLKACATDNVIFPMIILEDLKLRFDTSLPFAGGTDTKFFFEMCMQGVTIYECAEAIVYETVFASRLNLSWIMRRKYRSGITTAWRRIRLGNSKSYLIFRSVSNLSLNMLLSCFLAIIFQRNLLNKHLLKSARAIGILAGTLGVKTNSYVNVDQ